jgi:carbon-monoxide dehydrogenase catalytic subunit
MEQDNVVHIEFDEHHAMEDAKRIVKMAIDNFTEPRQRKS